MDRYEVMHNNQVGEVVYTTDDFVDACRELECFGRAYVIVDTKTWKKYKLCEVKKIKERK